MGSQYVNVTQTGTVRVLELSLPDSLDSDAFDRLNEDVREALSKSSTGKWILDLSNTSYMGSSVLGLMINIRQIAKDTGNRLVLCGLSARLTQIFHTCCLERLFTITKTRDEAVRSLGAK